MTEISLSSSRPSKVKADVVVVGVAVAGDRLVVADGGQAVEAAMGHDFPASLRSLGVDGKHGGVTRLPTAGALRSPVLVVLGLGEVETAQEPERLRRAAGSLARSLEGIGSAAVALPVGDPAAAGAVAEGLLLGAYAFRTYKTGEGTAPVGTVTMLTTAARDRAVVAAVERAREVAAAVNLARDWVNTPPNDMTPAGFADAARALARSAGLSVDVLDEDDLAAGGYGGLIAVGQGSTHPPRLVRLAYSPRKPVAHLALVGKGITFDSGGLSIKPAEGMKTMKTDMAGAAAVVTATAAIARLGLPVAVTAYAALAENMPSGTAQRPSDTYHAYGGRTVEVLNTDAEGRLVLADVLARAAEDSPDVLLDVATLTGAMVIALGNRLSGVMANDDDLRAAVVEAAGRAGEQAWPMPLPMELREKLDSPVADIANVGDRVGAGLQAALFLQEFVPAGQRWAHIDIAGPAFNTAGPYGYTPKGGTGEGVRTLVAYADGLAAAAT